MSDKFDAKEKLLSEFEETMARYEKIERWLGRAAQLQTAYHEYCKTFPRHEEWVKVKQILPQVEKILAKDAQRHREWERDLAQKQRKRRRG